MTPELFEGTLKSVLRAAAPGAKFIYRSGSYELPPPPAILPHVEHDAALSRELLAIDRSATYGSFYVFSVKSNGVQGTTAVNADATTAIAAPA